MERKITRINGFHDVGINIEGNCALTGMAQLVGCRPAK